MFTKHFWRIALEYALKSAAQTLVAVLTVSNVLDIHLTWTDNLSIIIVVIILSFLTSVATAKIKNGYHE